MASKNKFNIVLGATINKEALQKELNKISETKIKINIDIDHLRSQIQSVFNNIKINIGSTSSATGVTGGVATTRSGSSQPKSTITRTTSVKTYYDEENQQVRELVTGYDELGRSISEVNRLSREGDSITKTRISSTMEEGNLINKNAQSYENLSARLEHLRKNGQINNKQYAEFKQRLEQLNPSLDKTKGKVDQFEKSKAFKHLGQDISDAGKHAMSFGDMLKTAYEKFANFTPKIATSYRNVC